MREGQTAQAADPGDLVVLQVENGEAAAALQPCDLAEAVVWQPRAGQEHNNNRQASEEREKKGKTSMIACKDTSQIQFAEVQIGRQILHFGHAVVG